MSIFACQQGKQLHESTLRSGFSSRAMISVWTYFLAKQAGAAANSAACAGLVVFYSSSSIPPPRQHALQPREHMYGIVSPDSVRLVAVRNFADRAKDSLPIQSHGTLDAQRSSLFGASPKIKSPNNKLTDCEDLVTLQLTTPNTERRQLFSL